MTIPTAALFGHDPDGYVPHWLHVGERAYPETNCYTDVIIELLHARGDDPVSVMGVTVRSDFEGDQWTFFKPHTADLELLLGVDIHEMQLYRSLDSHIFEQVSHGKTMIVELDSWYLPDTFATSYHAQHVKTSVAIEAIDLTGQRLWYYHNRGLHQLVGDDFLGALRLGPPPSDVILPPYAEIVTLDESHRLARGELLEAARSRLRIHLQHAPSSNPFHRFADQLSIELHALLDGDSEDYHAYAFATVRMVGAAFELCRAHIDWLLGPAGGPACEAFDAIVADAKLLGFKLSRRKAFDPTPVVGRMASAWHRGFEAVHAGLG